MKAPNNLMDATEVTTCRNGVETVSIKEKHYFILRYYLATIFRSLINADVTYISKLIKLRQNQSVSKLFP